MNAMRCVPAGGGTVVVSVVRGSVGRGNGGGCVGVVIVLDADVIY